MIQATIRPAGDLAVTVEFANEISPEVQAQIRGFVSTLEKAALPGIVEIVPTYRSVTVHYRPEDMLYGELTTRLQTLLADAGSAQDTAAPVIELPVRYGGEMGPDLPFVAQHCKMSEAEVIRLHSQTEYPIYMLGFTPGFPYLGGMDERLRTPRLTTPRTKIPAGSVGIADAQTGAYPLESPGGWQLIGRTPVKLYDPQSDSPILLRAGWYVKFRPIDDAEYERIAQQVAGGRYVCKQYMRND